MNCTHWFEEAGPCQKCLLEEVTLLKKVEEKIDELDKRAEELEENLDLQTERLGRKAIELGKIERRVKELERVLKLVQQWGEDSRSVGAYEVFAEVTKVLGGVPEHPLKVVDCTCVPCVCSDLGGGRCLGCGARTCMAHTLAKGDSR